VVRLFFDTNVLVASLVEDHPAHERSLPYLQKIKSGETSGVISAHALAELYAILTTLPTHPRIPPAVALEAIRSIVLERFEIVPLTVDDYRAIIERQADLRLTGGSIYDGLHMQAAERSNVDQIITLNERDFRRVYPALADRIITP
jgi:predicted nucleic acid-binding protein